MNKDMYSVCKQHCEICKYGKYDGGYYDEYYCTTECPDTFDFLCLNCRSCEYKDKCKLECQNEVKICILKIYNYN